MQRVAGWGMVALAVLAAIWWFGLRTDPRVDALNHAIETQGSAALRHYAYPFRVLRVDGSVAVMGSPRSAQMPVQKMIRVIDPSLEGADPGNADFIAAEKQMATLQFEARAIVLAQPGISAVRFELDRDWLRSQGIDVD